MRNDFKTVSQYIGTFPEETQEILETLRETIKKVIPKAEETISYQIPTFKIKGKYIIYFAGFRDHVSIYPAPRGVKEFEEELSKYKGGKGTVQFPLDKPIPVGLVKRIVKYRLKQREEESSYGRKKQ